MSVEKIDSIMDRFSALERKLADCEKLCAEKQNELYQEFFTIVTELMPIIYECLMTSRFFAVGVTICK
ncbi:hypothetical protein [Citrobacter freundii]|uniref:hypothetical protein n=1 Tax=Citrobacter freundii TaxID=546 RepID=UPI001F323ADD|nr:hypothetical protein [Citrobacter freundii]